MDGWTLAATIVLSALALYLLTLGATALMRPARASSFLSGFARNWRVNAFEALCRAACGLALVRLDTHLWLSRSMSVLGIFLLVSAAIMIVLPDPHRRLAPRLVGAIAPHMTLFGLASLVLGGLLIAALLGSVAGPMLT